MNYQKVNLQHPFLKPLQHISDPPQQLFLRGQLPMEGKRPKVVAVVGSRRSTGYGMAVTQALVTALARHQVVVLSGLAFGIDSIAHRACLDAGGLTVAVLGTRINHIYPISHAALAGRILERGAILSEYGPRDQVPPKVSFLIRNRIISALADAVVVVEAAERSGTLATASHALNQGKELFAVPGDITRPVSIGCNHLIEQGARVYTRPRDVLDLLFPQATASSSPPQLPMGDSPLENHLIQYLAQGFTDGEELQKQLQLPVSEFNQVITLLELKGIVRAQGFNRWLLVC